MDGLIKLQTIDDKDSFKRANRLLAAVPHGVVRAGRRAANATVKTGQRSVSRLLSKEVGSNVRGIMHATKIFKAGVHNPGALLRVKSRGMNLIEFGARQTGTGITSRIKRVPHAFIARGVGAINSLEGGNKLVFIRMGERRIMKRGTYRELWRQPIVGVKGMTAQELMRHIPGAMTSTRNQMAVDMKQNLVKETARELKRAAAEAQA